MTREDVSELRTVRAASYGAASCLALLTYVLASLPVQRELEADFMADAHVVMVVEAPQLVHVPEVRPEEAPSRVVRARSTHAADETIAVRLWTYSSTGEIVFDWPEQYERCVRARARGGREADCPDPNDTRELALRNRGPANFDLRDIVLATRTQRP